MQASASAASRGVTTETQVRLRASDCEDGKCSGCRGDRMQTMVECFQCLTKHAKSPTLIGWGDCQDPDDGWALPQSELPTHCTECTCKPGYYDASQFEINCWNFDKKFSDAIPAPQADLLNQESVADINAHRLFESALKANWTSPCVRCPDCVDCSNGSNVWDVKIKKGYGLATQRLGDETGDRGQTVLDVFSCPLTGSCLNLTIADVLDGEYRSCAEGYVSTPAVPLCAYCLDSYTKENNECTLCMAVRAAPLPF